MNVISFLSQFVEHHAGLAYGAVFVGTLVEGEFVMIVAGILAHLRILPIVDTIAVGYLGALGKMIGGYWLGGFLGVHFPGNRFLKFIEKKVLYLLPKFKERPFWSILFSKFVYGINHMAIIFAGYVHARFRTYMIAECISSLIWQVGIFSLGYFFSYTAFGISHDLKKAALIMLVFIIAFMIIQKTVAFIIEMVERSAQE